MRNAFDGHVNTAFQKSPARKAIRKQRKREFCSFVTVAKLMSFCYFVDVMFRLESLKRLFSGPSVPYLIHLMCFKYLMCFE